LESLDKSDPWLRPEELSKIFASNRGRVAPRGVPVVQSPWIGCAQGTPEGWQVGPFWGLFVPNPKTAPVNLRLTKIQFPQGF